MDQPVGLYAAKSYVAAHGMPEGIEDYPNHRFVGHEDEDSRAPYHQWLAKVVGRKNVVFRSNDPNALAVAVVAGAGIGFMTPQEAAMRLDLVQVALPRPEWTVPLWLVTHVDLHRTSKVQALLKFLKSRVRDGNL